MKTLAGKHGATYERSGNTAFPEIVICLQEVPGDRDSGLADTAAGQRPRLYQRHEPGPLVRLDTQDHGDFGSLGPPVPVLPVEHMTARRGPAERNSTGTAIAVDIVGFVLSAQAVKQLGPRIQRHDLTQFPSGALGDTQEFFVHWR